MYIESVSGRVYELAAAGDLAAFAAKADLTTTEPALSSASTCRAERIAMGSLFLVVLLESAQLAQHAWFDLAELLHVGGFPTAVEVQQEVLLAMNSAVLDTMNSAAVSAAQVQAEIVLAMNAALLP